MTEEKKKLSSREKLFAKYTFASYWQYAQEHKTLYGEMSRKQVICLQLLFAHEAGKCVHCGSTEDLTADHIVPAFFLKMLGYNVDNEFRLEWYQCLCRKCNFEKAYRIEWNNPRTIEILNQAMIDKPTWEYRKILKEHTKHKDIMILHAKKHDLITAEEKKAEDKYSETFRRMSIL
jgi:5-methylcytosine-specific restriction endonuclease McrA